MSNFAKLAGAGLDPGGAGKPLGLVSRESFWNIAAKFFHFIGQAHGIFEGLAGSLGNILEHRVGGIAYQSDPVTGPVIGG